MQRHLALYHGVIPLLLKFTDNAEETFDAAMSQLVARGYLSKGQVVALVQSGKRPIWRSAATHTIQVRRQQSSTAAAAAQTAERMTVPRQQQKWWKTIACVAQVGCQGVTTQTISRCVCSNELQTLPRPGYLFQYVAHACSHHTGGTAAHSDSL